MKTIFGFFQQESGSPHPWFVQDDGEIIEDIDISLFPDLDLETHVAATFNGRELVSYSRDQSVAYSPGSTHSKRALVLVRDSLDGSELKGVAADAKWYQDHYNRAMQGHRTVEVLPFLFENTENLPLGLRERDIWNRVQDHVGDSFTHLHIIGDWSRNCGVALLGGTRAKTYDSPTCGRKTHWHEGEHNDGVAHAWAMGVEYRETKRIMGAHGKREWLNAPHLFYKNALDNQHIEEFLSDDNGHSFLAGFNTLELAVPPGAKRILVLRQNHEHRWISVSLDEDQVDIHVPAHANSQSFRATNLIKSLAAGDSFEIAGRQIHFENYDAGIASVVIDGSSNRKAWPTYPQIEKIGLGRAHGLWGNPQWGAQGIHVMPGSTENELRVTWITWDFNHNPIWATGLLTIQDNEASGTLYLDDNTNPVEARLVVMDEMNGLFYARIEHELFATPLKRVSVGVRSTFRKLATGDCMIEEHTNAGTSFSYILIPSKMGMMRRIPSNWKLKQDGVTYQFSGGMRGVKTQIVRQ